MLAPMSPQVEIVVPVFNEELALGRSIRRLHDFLCASFPFTWRIVIADNASTDATPAIARALGRELRGVSHLRLHNLVAPLRTPRTGTAGAASVHACDMPSCSACWPSGFPDRGVGARHRGRPGAVREDHLAGFRPLHRRSDRRSGAPDARALLADRRVRPYFDARTAWHPGALVYKDLYAIHVGSRRAAKHPRWLLRTDPAGACTSRGPATGAAARSTRPTSPTPRSGVRGSRTPAAVWPAAIAACTSTT